jgi:hypothetical protein
MPASEHPRAIGDQSALAQSLDTSTGLIERDKCGVMLFSGDGEPLRRRRKVHAVDSNVEATVAGMDFEGDCPVVRYDKRWGAPAVHSEGRTDEGPRAGREQRAAGRHRICA